MEDFIESVFDTCDEEETEEGLTLTEVKERHCLDYLTITIGMLDDNIERVFEAIDENGDGFVSKQESFNAIDRRGRGGMRFDSGLYECDPLWCKRLSGDF